MEAFSPNERPFKPQAFRQDLTQPRSPPRVSTDPQATSRKSHLHGLHHHHHKHHRHHSHSRHAKEVVQSAVQLHPPTSFGDLLKQASRSKDNSPSESRRESVAKGDQNGEAKAPPQNPVHPEDVARERARVKAREEQLRSSLKSLSDQSLKTSRQLDDTYYSILEKISVLRQTIGNLQELSSLTKELHQNFQSDTKELVEEIDSQVDGFSNFERQEEQIKGLEERISSGREKADALTARLAEARKRTEARAKLEAEWETRTARRLKMFWGILGTIASLVLVAILFQQLKPMHVARDTSSSPHFSLREALIDAPIPEEAKDAIVGPLPVQPSQRVTAPPTSQDVDNDNRLRIFDEL